MKTFGPVFTRWMDQANLNQSSLAEKVNVSQSNLSRVARGLILPEADTLDAILKQVSDKSDRLNLVQAYINDALGDEAKAVARELPVGILNDRTEVTSTLTPRGQRALNFLLALRPKVPAVEDMFVDIAKTVGWKDDSSAMTYPSARSEAMIMEDKPNKERRPADPKRAARQ